MGGNGTSKSAKERRRQDGLEGMELEGCDDSEAMPQLSGSTTFPWSHVHSIGFFFYLYYSCRVLIFLFLSLHRPFPKAGLVSGPSGCAEQLDPWTGHGSGGNHGAAMLVETEMLNTLPLAGMIRPMKGLQGTGFFIGWDFKEKI